MEIYVVLGFLALLLGTIVFPQPGEVQDLKLLLGVAGYTTSGGVDYFQYQNNYTPVNGSTLGNFTVAANASAANTILPADWTFTAGNPSTAARTGGNVTVTVSGTQTIYGYYVVDHSTGLILLWAELWSGGPFTFPSGGGTLVFTPSLTCQ